ncbi:MAG: DUF4956 domain-containing protein [Jiangellales bacterium]
MTSYLMIAADLVAVGILTFGLFFPRHRRRDLVVAYLAVNVGVLAVATALGSGAVGVGLGLGLFGVLSIIRLRSFELGQREIAYYFVALALGLLAGVAITPAWLTPVLMAIMLTALWLGDHPSLFPGYRTTLMTLDRAFTSEAETTAHLEALLGGRVHRLVVRKVDLVNDTTAVEVRYEVPDATADRRLVAAGEERLP